MKKILTLIILLFLVSCKKEKEVGLSADREAPLGWIYLNMYDDNSFDFVSKGLRNHCCPIKVQKKEAK